MIALHASGPLAAGLRAGPDTPRLTKTTQRLPYWPSNKQDGFCKNMQYSHKHRKGQNMDNKRELLRCFVRGPAGTKTCSATKWMNLVRNIVGAVHKVTSCSDERVAPSPPGLSLPSGTQVTHSCSRCQVAVRRFGSRVKLTVDKSLLRSAAFSPSVYGFHANLRVRSQQAAPV